jgi:hypothetical protein
MTHKTILRSYALLRAQGLHDWNLVWQPVDDDDPQYHTLAETRHESKTIVLDPSMGPRIMKQVLKHEIAPALLGPDHSHDQVWKDKARQIGCRLDYVSAFVGDERDE